MWEVKFSAEGEEGRSRQIAKMQHNGTLVETLVVAGKVMEKQTKAAQSSVVGVRFQRVVASSSKEVKFKS